MTHYDESLLCDVCGNRHVTEKRLTTEALLDLITQRQAHFAQRRADYDDDQMERALHNLHRLGEHVEAFQDRIRAALRTGAAVRFAAEEAERLGRHG